MEPGRPERISAGGRLLYIGKVQTADEGSYTCECSNAAGSSRREHRLEVDGESERCWGRSEVLYYREPNLCVENNNKSSSVSQSSLVVWGSMSG